MIRRDFLKLSTGALLALSPLSQVFAYRQSRSLLSCRSDAAGKHHLTAISPEGELQFDVVLPGRGHGMCVRPDGAECVVFARRPDDFMWAVDFHTGQVRQKNTSPQGRHYYGHGVFDPAGRLLYVTENAYDEGRGVIGVYDATDNYRRLGELPSHGIGPHELKLMPDGKTLVIANGGILTHPDTGRNKLNLPEMNPSLAYVDSANGQLLGQYRPPAHWHQLSIRHLDVTADNTVCVAMQYQGSAKEHPPLVAMHRGEDDLQMLTAPADTQQQMRNYCGSVSCDHSGQIAAVSSPRGNLITLWSTQTGELLSTLDYTDGCGLAADLVSGGFFASNGQGRIAQFLAGENSLLHTTQQQEGWHWDNHMIAYNG